ncbi:hypothetical protein EV175_005087 [Coemansia sp. RSA 1933]|nr:hypothetical protein EV175_005087 [Coemansia sp. RSA 1933]
MPSSPIPSPPKLDAQTTEPSLLQCENTAQSEEPLLIDEGIALRYGDNNNDGWVIERQDLTMDISDGPSAEMLNEQLAKVFNEIFAPVTPIEASQVSMDRLVRGLTNLVYIATVDPAPVVPESQASRILRGAAQRDQNGTIRMPQKYILRIYGTGVDEYLSREKELFWLGQLASLKIGPQIYGIFANGRLEEFLESTTLTVSDTRLAPTSRQIAQKLCELHTLVGNRNPTGGSSSVRKGGNMVMHFDDRKSDMWTDIDKWMKLVKQKWVEIRRICDGNAKCTELLDNWHELEHAVNTFKAHIEKESKSPVIFAHNDLLSENILRLGSTGELVLIDYEFAGYNYRGFDIANHFSTWMYNFSNPEQPHLLDLSQYPTVEQRHNFLHAYVQAKSLMDADASMTGQHAAESVELCTSSLTEGQIHREVEMLDREVAYFMSAPLLQWGMWGLLQACSSEIDFDFASYSAQRLSIFIDHVANLK